ncbi:hypothetical protein ACFXGT_11470 [Streptomyces sp. NPDC059352]|uniref:hypothetical protein n=1 Tax=Streptomyces sp. NPDC059352 TaxID=3346810 RepID=UPI0036879B3F
MICRTPEGAFQAGLSELCEHDVSPAACPKCQLTDLEISRLVVLYREHALPTPAEARPARAA